MRDETSAGKKKSKSGMKYQQERRRVCKSGMKNQQEKR
jgi:hypothetical protein